MESEILHQGMREADFGTVDGAIAGGFDDGKKAGILGIKNDSIDYRLR